MKRCLACDHRFAAADWRCPACAVTPARCEGRLQFAPELAEWDGFTRRSFDDLVQLEHDYFWFRARTRLILWALDTYFPAATSFLEVGCGTGHVLASISAGRPGLRLAGAELAAAGLRHASARLPGIELFQMDACVIPFADEFSVIGAFDVLEHVDDDAAALAAMHGAVRPGGGLLLTVPQHPFLWGPPDTYARHKRRYRRRELEAKVRRAGFGTVRATSFVSLLLPALIATRLVQRRSGHRYDPLDEYRVGAVANRLLEAVLGLERACISAGLSFPAGGSLLLVARKA